MSTPTTPLRWGILSTANIARKNWDAIRHSGSNVVTAVASRSLEKAQTFIDQCMAESPFTTAPRPLATYEELLAAADVDAVYIPIPTGIRKEWVIKAANAGKHVLCEKPCANSLADLTEMIEACRRNNVLFMDGVMFMHSSRLPLMAADVPKLGALKRITTQFSFAGDDAFLKGNIRTSGELERFGCLGDLGWYTTRLILFAHQYTLPVSVRASMLATFEQDTSSSSVPTELSAELFFADGSSASMYTSFLTNMTQSATLSGSKGALELFDFVLPVKGKRSVYCLVKNDFGGAGVTLQIDRSVEDKGADEEGNNHPTSQECKMMRCFAYLVHLRAEKSTPLPADCPSASKTEAFWQEIALKTQRVLDAVMLSAQRDGEKVVL